MTHDTDPSAASDPVLTTREAASHLGVAVSTAQLWMESGALASWKTPGGHRRCRRSAVLALMEGRAGAPLAAAPLALPAEFLAPAEPGYPAAPTEAVRLAALAASGLIGTPPEERFDRLAWLAAQLTGCPMALVSLLTAERQWFKARSGLEATETPRDWAFCSHSIMGEDIFTVEDARADARFRANPLVTGAPHIRFYAGIPVRDKDGNKLGTLCVLDVEPRIMTPEHERGLRELGAIVSAEIRQG